MNKKTILITFAMLALVVIQTGIAFGQSTRNISNSDAKTLAADSVASSSDAIVGSWYLTITSVSFPEPFRAMITFGDEGGVVASAQGDILLSPPPGVPPLATAAHGAWVRTANREYLFTFRQIYYNGDGSYAGGAKIRNAVTLNKSGTEMSGQLIVQYYDSNDVVVFTGTGTFTGTRISAEPLTP